MTAPAAPHGISQRPDEPPGVHVDGGEHHHRKADEDAAAERDEHVVDRQLAREPDEVHAPAIIEPAASDIREADGQPQGDWQVQNGQHLGVAAPGRVVDDTVAHGKTLAKTAPAAKGSASQSPLDRIPPALPHEVDGEQRENEQRRVAEVERRHFLIRAERKPEQRRQLDGQRGGRRQGSGRR